jgi:chemotaxis protein CheX
MNVKLANHFITATVNVLSTMAFVTPVAGTPFIKGNNKSLAEVSGTLGITGVNIKTKGCMTIAFTKGAILKIISNMLGESHESINADVCDAVGEITNMISGQARKKLSEMGQSFEASIPTIIVGKDQEIHHLKLPSVIIPFKIDEERFFVDICFTD